MTRTTPPRPVDIAAVFPALAPLAEPATRLHPRPGNPSPADSSVGGPLLWPVSDPWPHCGESHYLDGVNPARSLESVRQERAILSAARGRAFTPREREALDRVRPPMDYPITVRPPQPYEGSIPMLPVAQLYARDVPGLDAYAPAGPDLLQVLWCPFDHEDAMPRTVLFWRSADVVTDILTGPPEPADVQFEGYVVDPCVLDPERITEYPAPLELDEDLREQLEIWSVRHRAGVELDTEGYRDSGYMDYEEEARVYLDELSVAPGWKVGGLIKWGLQDPHDQPCPACDTPTVPLLTIAWTEWDGATGSWIPREIQDTSPSSSNPESSPSGILIGRGYDQIIRVCPVSPDHPHVQLMQ